MHHFRCRCVLFLMVSDPHADRNSGACAEHAAELLAILETGTPGFAILELARDTAMLGPPVDGVATFLNLAGEMHIAVPETAPVVAQAGQLVLVPAGHRATVSATSDYSETIDARSTLANRHGWVVSDATRGKAHDLVVAAARVGGTSDAALSGMVVIDVSKSRVGRPILKLLRDEYARGVDGHATVAMALMNACVVQGLKRAIDTLPRARASAIRHDPLTRVIAAIRERPNDSHSVDTLASLAGMSRSSFARLLLRTAGKAPQKFLTHVRLEEAATLLRSSDLPVKTIAAATGFASRSHFSRAFRGLFRVDPSEYRIEAAQADAEMVPEPVKGVPQTSEFLARGTIGLAK